jgi:hypothetical protein
MPHIIFMGALITMARAKFTMSPEVIPESIRQKVFSK